LPSCGWLIQVPSVQTAITRKVTQNLSKKLGTTVRIAGVDIDFFKTVVLEGIYVEDQRKDTLLYAGKLRVNIGVLSLANKTITANLIGLEEARANVYKAKGDTAFNYEFIPAAFASTDTTAQDTTSSGLGFRPAGSEPERRAHHLPRRNAGQRPAPGPQRTRPRPQDAGPPGTVPAASTT
jgi:hypothetical protein